MTEVNWLIHGAAAAHAQSESACRAAPSSDGRPSSSTVPCPPHPATDTAVSHHSTLDGWRKRANRWPTETQQQLCLTTAQTCSLTDLARVLHILFYLSYASILFGMIHYTRCTQLIVRKISKIGATSCKILKLKCVKCDFRWSFTPE